MKTYSDFIYKFELAGRIAEQAHENQKYGTDPYKTHLLAVIQVLERFGYKVCESNFNPQIANLLVAAWLHDVLEDTVLTKAHLVYDFGEAVTDLVWRVTDEPGKSRKEKKQATYPKIKSDPWAVVLKLADRIANVEAGLKMKSQGNKNLFNMYQKEYADFKQNLYDSPGPIPMWEHLDSLLK